MRDSAQPWAVASQLADLLRARRDRVRPEDVGLPSGVRRRTAGLRREEVAQLAGVSVSYYTLLEQGRQVRPSEQVIDALANALLMTDADRRHLRQLAGLPTGEGIGATGPETLSETVRRMVRRLDPFPTYVSGRYWDILAANNAARGLLADWSAMPPGEANMLWWMFTAPAARRVYVDWEAEASALLARFRAAAGRHPGDSGFGALLDRVLAASPQAREWWPRHDVRSIGGGIKRILHPTLGAFELRHAVLLVADDSEQKVVTFEPVDPSDDRFVALAASVD